MVLALHDFHTIYEEKPVTNVKLILLKLHFNKKHLANTMLTSK